MTSRIIIEADGGSRGNPGPAGYGALVRDPESGTVLAERADHLGVVSNNVAEYSGLVAGLRAAREIDPDAAIDPMADPGVRDAVAKATFQHLVGFQLTADQLKYNATR